MQQGNLYLIPTVLAENATQTIPAYIKDIIIDTDFYIVENLKTARRFIKSIYKEKNIDECVFLEMDKHKNYQFDDNFLTEIFNGKNIGLMSEAGVPCIADPGNKVVEIAHEMEIKVVPLVGPSSIVLALMASGFNGQQFAFNGYLPIDSAERKNKLLQMEAAGKKELLSYLWIHLTEINAYWKKLFSFANSIRCYVLRVTLLQKMNTSKHCRLRNGKNENLI
jgi:16S rRNA (cytidine1402-2'-O)-methyltransferase